MTVGLCLVVGQALRVFVPALAFTLGWTHSVEKTGWEEDWRVVDDGLVLVEARIAGSGAGMEPPQGAVLRDGVWHYAPPARVHRAVALAVSPYAQPYRFCVDGRCRPLAEVAGITSPFATVHLERCESAVLTTPGASR